MTPWLRISVAEPAPLLYFLPLSGSAFSAVKPGMFIVFI
jgi:hypothetical protein